MKTKNKHLISFEAFKDSAYGHVGTKRRDEFEAGFENFRMGALLHEARLEKGLTQEELAKRAGTTKSYISKIENNVKEVRLSTLEKIIKRGLGGSLEISIKI
jgi:DNA-binding XRE family transcriptional regulator